jgi:uncharacterized protein YraI
MSQVLYYLDTGEASLAYEVIVVIYMDPVVPAHRFSNWRNSMNSAWKRIATWTLFLLACPSFVAAQQATVKRNVNLRSDPSTNNAPVELLQAGTTLVLLDSATNGGYLHVKAADGQEGWVWSKNVSERSGTTTPTTPLSGASPQCDDSLWDHVYNPQRLIVKQKCIAVTGIIMDATKGQHSDGVRHEADGDTHGWLNLDSQFKNLLNAGNLSDESGNLVFEVVCMFKVTQADAIASCPPSFQNPVKIPPVGSHVRIVGTYVQDTNHSKWMEIHPVTSITVIP